MGAPIGGCNDGYVVMRGMGRHGSGMWQGQCLHDVALMVVLAKMILGIGDEVISDLEMEMNDGDAGYILEIEEGNFDFLYITNGGALI